MSQIGNYVILSELGRSKVSASFRVRRADEPADTQGQFVAKIFDVEALALLESVASAQTFIERATLQKRLSDSGAHHWARVVEIGTVEDAFFITDFYPLTARQLVDSKIPIDAHALHTVLWSVVRGLTELRETARRAHGNLKLSNILIGGDTSLRSAETTQIVLDDPSVEASSGRERMSDLLALGELIHELVLKRPFRETRAAGTAETVEETVWPASFTAAWGKLGPDAERWLDLCNWLLSPDPSERPSDLVEVAVALHALAPRQIRRSGRWAAILLMPLLLAGAAGGFFYKTHSDARQQLASVNQQWVGAFVRALSDPQRQQRYNADDTLRSIAQQVQQAQSAGVVFDPSDTSVLSYDGYRHTRSALNLVETIERELAPERWKGLAAMNALRRQYEVRGWSQPAAFLAELNRGVTPAPNADLAAGIDRFLEVTGRINEDALWLNEEWLKYDADLETIRKAGDPLLTAFARSLREQVGQTLRLTDSGFDGLDAFKHRVPLASTLAKLSKDGFPSGYGRERIADEVDSQLNAANPTDADIRQWLDSIDQYRLVELNPAAEPLVSLIASYEKLLADVGRQNLSEAEQAEYAAHRTGLEQKLKSLRETRFVKRDVARAQGEIPIRAGDVQKDLDALRKQWVRLDDPKQWIDFVDQPLASASDALKLRWKSYIDVQRKRTDLLAKSIESFKKAKADTELIRGVLSELDKQFPQVTPGLSPRFATAAWERRERDLAMLTAWAASTNPAVPELEKFEAAVDDQGRRFLEWTDKLRSLAKDFPIRKTLLSPGERPDEAWAAKDREFWLDPIVQDLVRTDVERITNLAAVANMPQDELLKTASQSQAMEVVLAAWRRLGELKDGEKPAWPDDLPELEAELTLRNRLAPMINALPTDEEKRPIADEWRREGPVRWRRFANGAVVSAAGEPRAAIETRFKAAGDYRSAMSVPEAEIDKLDPAPRFNYALYVARGQITDASDTVARTEAQRLLRASVELKDRPPIAELIRKLERLGDQEPMAVDVKLLAASPPQTYTLPIRDVYSLKFVRLEPPGQRPFYLCTTELSLGQFIEVINSTGNWTTANALLGNLPLPGKSGPTPQPGPRIWDRPSAANASIDRFVSWRFDSPAEQSKTFRFEPTLSTSKFNPASLGETFGDNPKYDHPMQQLPAEAAVYAAAVLRCRLPTTEEWLAGYAMDLKTAGDPGKMDANLRDATWRIQQAYTTLSAPTQWPGADVAGVYWPKDLDRPAAATARSTDDKTLFFRSVNTGGGTFQNIIGNVAELVCDRDDLLDTLPDARSIDGVRRFCESYPSSIQIIGGSGLSAPELELTRPYPVNSTTEPYADVGLRLAFTAPARTMAERMKHIIDAQPYLAK